MTLINGAHHLRMYEVIQEREGIYKAQSHESEKTMIEFENYFDTHYTLYDADVEVTDIIADITEKLEKVGVTISGLINEYEMTDLLNIYERAGYVTKHGGTWVVSVDYPFSKRAIKKEPTPMGPRVKIST